LSPCAQGRRCGTPRCRTAPRGSCWTSAASRLRRWLSTVVCVFSVCESISTPTPRTGLDAPGPASSAVAVAVGSVLHPVRSQIVVCNDGVSVKVPLPHTPQARFYGHQKKGGGGRRGVPPPPPLSDFERDTHPLHPFSYFAPRDILTPPSNALI